MSQFFEDLWESIFTPGTTPSLLLATNATFAVLQLVLFVLLLATYSVHFIILSCLCAGLWYAINWFAAELKVLQRQEAEAAAATQAREDKAVQRHASPSDADSETEVEADAVDTEAGPAAGRGVSKEVEPVEIRGELKQRKSQKSQKSQDSDTADTADVPAVLVASIPDHSPRLSGSRSGVSTEDEWEKVSENE